jgi:hypothetical protein
MTVHQLLDYITWTVTGGSILYSFLPPWDAFADYPRFQKAYKFFMIFAVKIASANLRDKIYPQIQATSNQQGTESK